MRRDYRGLERAAGTINYKPISDKLDKQKYLNPSRRKILNDYVSIETETSPDEVVNNNKSNQLKMLVLKNSSSAKHHLTGRDSIKLPTVVVDKALNPNRRTYQNLPAVENPAYGVPRSRNLDENVNLINVL